MGTKSALEKIMLNTSIQVTTLIVAAILTTIGRLLRSGAPMHWLWFLCRRLESRISVRAVAALISFGAVAGNNSTGAAVPSAGESAKIQLASASEDHAGSWGVFQPGLGDQNGNGIAIANDWGWDLALNLEQKKSIASITVLHADSNQIWTTDDPIHWALVVFNKGKQLNHKFGVVMGPFKPGLHHFQLFGQIDGRIAYGTDLIIKFTDGSRLTAKVPRSDITYGGDRTVKPKSAGIPAPTIVGSAQAAASRLILDVPQEPVITRFSIQADGTAIIEAVGIPDQTYVLESTAELAGKDWKSVSTTTAAATGQFQFADPVEKSAPARFYRLRLQ